MLFCLRGRLYTRCGWTIWTITFFNRSFPKFELRKSPTRPFLHIALYSKPVWNVRYASDASPPPPSSVLLLHSKIADCVKTKTPVEKLWLLWLKHVLAWDDRGITEPSDRRLYQLPLSVCFGEFGNPSFGMYVFHALCTNVSCVLRRWGFIPAAVNSVLSFSSFCIFVINTKNSWVRFICFGWDVMNARLIVKVEIIWERHIYGKACVGSLQSFYLLSTF
jgi:hypothetical protein